MQFYIRPRLLSMIRDYHRKQFFADLNAGVIVGIVALPLSIAFAIASGVSPEKGLITSIVAGFIVSLLGGSRVLIGGPTGAFVIILAGIMAEFGYEGLIIASIMAGVIQISMGLFRVGAIFKFIPYPIIIGFNTGIAISIFTSQIPAILGLNITDAIPHNFVGKWIVYLQNISTFDPWALLVAVITILIILFAPFRFKRFPAMLLAIIIVTVGAYCLRHYAGIDSIRTIGDSFSLSSALPSPVSFTFDYDSFERLLSPALTIAIMGAIVTILSANIADGAIGDRHDSNTELVAQGVSNIVTPLLGGIPSTGAIARTMTNINSGGRTPIAGIVHAVVVLVILVFLGELARHIPVACLAGMLAVVSYNMADVRTVRALMRSPRSDVAVLLTTLFLTVFINLTIAIEVGLLMAIVLFLRRVNEATQVSVLRNELDVNQETDYDTHQEKLNLSKGVEIYEIDGPFFFGIANKFDEQMRAIGDRPLVRIIRMRKVPFIDGTGLHNLEMFITSSQREQIHIILSGVTPSVKESIKRARVDRLVGDDNVFDNINDAVVHANGLAVRRKKSLRE